MRQLVRKEWRRIQQERGIGSYDPRLWFFFVRRIYQLVIRFLRARWAFRKATLEAPLVFAYGQPQVDNQGQLVIGPQARFWSNIHPVQLIVGPQGCLKIGANTYINGSLLAAQRSIIIGDGVYIAPMAQLFDSYAFGWREESASAQLAPIVVEQHAWIATRATILPGVRIGEGAVVGVGAIVTEDVPPYTVVAGIPARVIRQLATPQRKEEEHA